MAYRIAYSVARQIANHAQWSLHDTKNPLQRFVWHDDVHPCSGGPIQLQQDDSFCLTWSGVTMSPGVDSMIMIQCDKLQGDRSLGWIAV